MFHLIGPVFYTKSQLPNCRESMLTKLLMESLGGKSLALMIACVSPAASAVDETLSTLHYATCANNIVNAPSINLDSRDKVTFISPLLIPLVEPLLSISHKFVRKEIMLRMPYNWKYDYM